jgi:hypothetical protein
VPDFTYQGPGERVYPESRDSRGVNLGLVTPGDIRDLDEAPDGMWLPLSEDEELPDGQDGPPGDGPDGGEPEAPVPAGPAPAPPAAAPSA